MYGALALLSLLALLPACGGSAGADEDASIDTAQDPPVDVVGDTPGDVEPDSPLVPSVGVGDQTLDLSTRVSVDEVVSDGPGWIVVHEDSAGTPGPAIGLVQVGGGASTLLRVDLDRPAVDGETLFAMLHADTGAVGTFEFPGGDDPVLGPDEMPVAPAFVVTVPAGTPEIRITVAAVGFSAYDFTGIEPSSESGVVGPEADNQTLTLEEGRRYEIVNLASAGHPFDLVVLGSSPAGDVVLLSQSAAGSMEADAGVGWFDDGDRAIRFTLSAGLAAVLSGYRCSIHTAAMRGSITPI